MPAIVIGTAGHIDHGKTALLRALTGIDADRLPEERARGMTIDVGFAHLAFDDGVELDFVDVPGHDRLIGNMLVGAGEIDAVMLVVAADDGPRPQTLEHLQLLDALEIADGLVVVTKADLVDVARADDVVAQVRSLLAGTTLAAAPVLVASATTGEGLERLRVELRGVRDRAAGRRAVASSVGRASPHRLAIDRVFAAKGRGVVVTGTLRGAVATGAWLRSEPGGELLRVRELQVHGEPRELHRGGRTAFNIAGSGADKLKRGDVLTGADSGVSSTDRLLVRLRPPAPLAGRASAPSPSGARLRLHVGTAQVEASFRRVRAAEDLGVLTLAGPIATFAGDRAVLREPASGALVGGLRVLDVAPPRGASRRRMNEARLAALSAAVDDAAPERIEQALLELHGILARDARRPTRPVARSLSFADDVRLDLADTVIDAVAAHHRAAPMSPGLPLPRARAALLRRLRSIATLERQHVQLATSVITELLDGLVADGRLARHGDALRDPTLAGDLSPELLGAMDRLEAALAVAAPPSLNVAAQAAGCPAEGIHALQADGRIVRLGPDLAWSATTYHGLAAVALDRARTGPISPAALRDATGTSRKYVLAILEDLDRRGILQRTPEGHIPGPRAPRLRAGADDGPA